MNIEEGVRNNQGVFIDNLDNFQLYRNYDCIISSKLRRNASETRSQVSSLLWSSFTPAGCFSPELAIS